MRSSLRTTMHGALLSAPGLRSTYSRELKCSTTKKNVCFGKISRNFAFSGNF